MAHPVTPWNSAVSRQLSAISKTPLFRMHRCDLASNTPVKNVDACKYTNFS
jgi:hypothetical protein